MSGGSFNYKCFDVENTYAGQMEDPELNELLADFVIVLHDLEWWRSGDYGEEDYRKTVQKFKNKWFGKRDINLRKRLIAELESTKKLIQRL